MTLKNSESTYIYKETFQVSRNFFERNPFQKIREVCV